MANPSSIVRDVASRSAVMLGLLIGCTGDRNVPSGPTELPLEPSARGVSLALECPVDPEARTLGCGAPSPATDESTPADVILGGQGAFVQMISTPIVVQDGLLVTDVSLQNRRRQVMGTPGSEAVTGITVFFHHQLPSAGVTVANPDGLGRFTRLNQPYFFYDQKVVRRARGTGRGAKLTSWRSRARAPGAFG